MVTAIRACIFLLLSYCAAKPAAQWFLVADGFDCKKSCDIQANVSLVR
jgi:hypothetical protein